MVAEAVPQHAAGERIDPIVRNQKLELLARSERRRWWAKARFESGTFSFSISRVPIRFLIKYFVVFIIRSDSFVGLTQISPQLLAAYPRVVAMSVKRVDHRFHHRSQQLPS